MARLLHVLLGLVAVFALAPSRTAQAQIFTLTRDQMVAYTPKNTFDRFEDGRPKIPDALLARAAVLTVEEILGVVNGAKYPNQFEGNWQILQPGKKLIG